jgi:hypothetical protein
MGKHDSDQEDLAIQDTLSMTPDERVELLASLIVDQIAADVQSGEQLYKELTGASDG